MSPAPQAVIISTLNQNNQDSLSTVIMGVVESCIALLIVMDSMTHCFAAWRGVLEFNDYHSRNTKSHPANISKTESASTVPHTVRYKFKHSHLGHLSYAELKHLKDTQSYKKYVIGLICTTFYF